MRKIFLFVGNVFRRKFVAFARHMRAHDPRVRFLLHDGQTLRRRVGIDDLRLRQIFGKEFPALQYGLFVRKYPLDTGKIYAAAEYQAMVDLQQVFLYGE